MSDLSDVAAMLREVNAGRLALYPQENPQEVYAGNVEYRTTTGWSLVVFNDCNDWDYFDSITAPDGTRWDFDALWDAPAITAESPRSSDQPADLSWRIYGIPGHMTYRCVKCSRSIWPVQDGMVCTSCGGKSTIQPTTS